MANQWMRCNLSAAQFPFTTDQWGRSIILPQYDQTYERNLSGVESAKDKGIPQAFYMHNVIPTAQGYQSVAYDTLIPAMSGSHSDFDTVFELSTNDPQLARVLYTPAGGEHYVFDATVNAWAAMTAQGLAGFSTTPESSTAAIADKTVADMSWTLPNSTEIVKLGLYSNSAVSTTVMIVQRNSAGNFTVVASKSISHTGTGWEDFALTSPYTTAASGSFYVAAYANATVDVNAATNGAYITGTATGTSGGWTEGSTNVPPVRAIQTVTLPVMASTTLVTTALVNGQTYIGLEGIGVFIYDTTNKQLFKVTLSGITDSAVKGVCAAQGYMIIWDDTSISWSNVSNPTDFVPSLATGAGGGQIQYVKGTINFCVPISNGFMIYCSENVVSATYSNNVRYPFLYKEVTGSGGVRSPEQVSHQSNLGMHYAWGTAGLQELTKDNAAIAKPDVTDFLASLALEDFDETTLQLTTTYLEQPLSVKVAAIADRYVIISYGAEANQFTYALWYDTSLKRWGKLKLDHVKCFEWPAPSLYGSLTYDNLAATDYSELAETTYADLATGADIPELPRKNIAFLKSDGSVVAVNLDLAQTSANGVLILGKFQFSRNRWFTHQMSDIENVRDGNTFSFYLIPSLDGKTFEQCITPVLLRESPLAKRYGMMYSAQNISALFVGSFNLTSYLINYTLSGEW